MTDANQPHRIFAVVLEDGRTVALRLPLAVKPFTLRPGEVAFYGTDIEKDGLSPMPLASFNRIRGWWEES